MRKNVTRVDRCVSIFEGKKKNYFHAEIKTISTQFAVSKPELAVITTNFKTRSQVSLEASPRSGGLSLSLLLLSLSTCIPRQVRARAASTCIPTYPVDLIPPLYYFVLSTLSCAFARASLARSRARWRARAFSGPNYVIRRVAPSLTLRSPDPLPSRDLSPAIRSPIIEPHTERT